MRDRLLPGALLLGGAMAGFALHGPVAVSGIAAGILGAVVLRRSGAPMLTCSIALAIPPLIPAAAAPLAVPAALALVAAYQQWSTPWVFLASALALPLPGADAVVIPGLGAGLFIAVAPVRTMAAGIPLALAPWLAGLAASPLVGAALLTGGLMSRGLAAHPANATVARGLVQFGLAASPAPAAVAVLFAAIGAVPEQVIVVSYLATAVILAGALVAATHVGLAVLLRSSGASPAMWMTLAWAPGFVAFGAMAEGTIGRSVAIVAALIGLSAAPAAVGLHWLFRAFARNRGQDSRVHGIIRNVHSPAASSAPQPRSGRQW